MILNFPSIGRTETSSVWHSFRRKHEEKKNRKSDRLGNRDGVHGILPRLWESAGNIVQHRCHPRAHDYGCTFFDTAETYGREQFYRGHNEEIVGRAVEGFRKDIVLATKLHISTEEYDPEGDIYNVLLRHLTASMRRLRTDYVDLYYLHRFNEAIPIEKIAESMGRLIREGKIRGWGLSQVDVSILSKAHEITPVTAVQNLYSMVERDCEKEIFPYCIEHHIGVVPFSPLASGLLSGKVTAETKFALTTSENSSRSSPKETSKATADRRTPRRIRQSEKSHARADFPRMDAL